MSMIMCGIILFQGARCHILLMSSTLFIQHLSCEHVDQCFSWVTVAFHDQGNQKFRRNIIQNLIYGKDLTKGEVTDV